VLDPTLARLFEYSDWANDTVLKSAQTLTPAQLDQPLDIGPKPGSLRRILMHIGVAEAVWLGRWKGQSIPWPDETAKLSLEDITRELATIVALRSAFLATLTAEKLQVVQPYRDSKGSLFKATLRDMLLQGLTHSTHHRAQAANAIRRLGGTPPELDLMYHFQTPTE
jgi:uncharacterized damage-inducible protein DinB